MRELARTQIAQSAARYTVPVVASRREFVEAGALLSYGPHPVERWRRSCPLRRQVTEGRQRRGIASGATEHLRTGNQPQSRKVGLAIPQLLLLQADQVIQ